MKQKRLKSEAMKLSRKDSARRSIERIRDSAAKENQRKMNPEAERERVKLAMANARQDEEKHKAEKIRDSAAKENQRNVLMFLA